MWDAEFVMGEQGQIIKVHNITPREATEIKNLFHSPQHMPKGFYSEKSGSAKGVIIKKLGFFKTQKIEYVVKWYRRGVDEWNRPIIIAEFFIKYI